MPGVNDVDAPAEARNVYAGDGSLLSSTFEATSNYESRDQIIRIGKAKP